MRVLLTCVSLSITQICPIYYTWVLIQYFGLCVAIETIDKSTHAVGSKAFEADLTYSRYSIKKGMAEPKGSILKKLIESFRNFKKSLTEPSELDLIVLDLNRRIELGVDLIPPKVDSLPEELPLTLGQPYCVLKVLYHPYRMQQRRDAIKCWLTLRFGAF